MNIIIDSEFKSLIPPLLPDEFKQLEANILRDDCRDPLCIWDGHDILVDGHNRHNICTTHRLPFQIKLVKFDDRDQVKLWIGEQQLGRRNLTDDQRAMVADDVRKVRSTIASHEAAKKGRAAQLGVSAKSTETPQTKTDTRKIIAKDTKLPERKIRLAQEIKKADQGIADMVRAGTVTLIEGKRIAALPAEARKTAAKAVASGADVRSAVRDAKKEDYNARIGAAKPKLLEGTYRIIYADPPWKYVGLNQADEYGHAERHYDCLTDRQLMEYRPGGGDRLVKDMADRDAVLFMWVTAPMSERCFPIIRAWGFEFKAEFIWDKIRHVMGHYNSVRHEKLLICTRGSCKPDVPRLIDSVQSIERSGKHSEKPAQFYDIIEGLYDHGRKLELFSRTARAGWDSDGNEAGQDSVTMSIAA